MSILTRTSAARWLVNKQGAVEVNRSLESALSIIYLHRIINIPIPMPIAMANHIAVRNISFFTCFASSSTLIPLSKTV